ncbi:SDR family oxidoreductase [soil metagenome]
MSTSPTAIITCASTCIGRAVALAFARAGYTVLLIARSTDKLKETQKLIEQAQGKAIIIAADLSTTEGINGCIASIKNHTSQVSVLANIAGIWHGVDEVYAGRNFDTFSQQVILDTFFVGTIAPTLLAHAVIPLMSPKSTIINLSGTFENGGKGWLPYFVSKRAIEDLTIGLAQELAEKDIQVFGISPSDTATEAYKKYFPEYFDDSIDPAEIATFAVSLTTPEYQTATGKIFVLKKGQKPQEAFHF